MPVLRTAALALAPFALIAAQPARSDPPAPPSGDCELHVWPAPALESMTEGWIRNQARDYALHDKDGKPTVLAGALGPHAQLDALASLDLPALLHLGNARVVAHEEPLPPDEPGAAAVRHAPSESGCYAELVIRHVVFANSALAGPALQTSFRFRVFGRDGQPPRSFSSSASTPLTPDTEGAAVNRDKLVIELAAALRSDVTLFAGYAAAPPKPHKRAPPSPPVG